MGDFTMISRSLGIVGYVLCAVNLAFWFRLIVRARRARTYPHFVTEMILFGTGLVFFVTLFLTAVAPMPLRSLALMALRFVALLLGMAFTAHTIVALRTAAHE